MNDYFLGCDERAWVLLELRGKSKLEKGNDREKVERGNEGCDQT